MRRNVYLWCEANARREGAGRSARGAVCSSMSTRYARPTRPLSLLVGVPAGAPDENDDFPEGSVNVYTLVVKRLRLTVEMISDEDFKEAEKKAAQDALVEKPA